MGIHLNTVEDFHRTARHYCDLIESVSQHSLPKFLASVRSSLTALYGFAIVLPELESTDEETVRDISHVEWTAICDAISEKLGRHDLYWEIFDPTVELADAPVSQTISDDLSDIWRDLKIGVDVWEFASEEMKKQIVWNWKFNFKHHWSCHLVDALRTINWLLEPHGIDTSE